MKRKILFVMMLTMTFVSNGCLAEPGTSGTPSGKSPETMNSSAVDDGGGSAVRDPNIPDASFTLLASGDVLSHISNTEDARKADGSYDYLPHFEGLGDALADADYTLVNLESTVSGEKYGYSGYPFFNAPLALAETLKQMGVDLVVTANNHALDSGVDGLKDNLDNLDRVGLEHLGTYRSQEEADQPFIREINWIRVGFAASTYPSVNVPIPEEAAFTVNTNRAADIRREVAELRNAGAEILVYHIHWGKEYTEYPSSVQMRLYDTLTREGVDIIIGSHPHRLQPVEMRTIEYQGDTKTQAVIWSTGNLYQGQTRTEDYVNTGAVFRLEVERRDGIVRVNKVTHELVHNMRWIDQDGAETYKLVPESAMEKYRTLYPANYDQMVQDFAWAEKTLNTPVTVIPTEDLDP